MGQVEPGQAWWIVRHRGITDTRPAGGLPLVYGLITATATGKGYGVW
jgi:hypothetical protein